MDMSTRVQPTVIVVEDEEVIGMFIREALLEVGFSVRSFSEAATALQSLEDPAVEAAVIDVRLPGALGDELTRHCHRRRPTLPIILTTGYDEQNYRDAFMADLYVRVLGKPFDIPRLLLRLEELGIYAAVES